jgi:hypothetical protein
MATMTKTATVQKMASGDWGFKHPFSAKWIGNFPSRDAARAARRAIKGAPDNGEPIGETIEPLEPIDLGDMPSVDEVKEAFEAIIGVPFPEPGVPDAPEPEPEPAPLKLVPKPGVAAFKTESKGYRLTTPTAPGYLRRDQPRKPGDTASYKVVERARATVIKTKRQADVKVDEALTLGMVAVGLEEIL